MPVKFGPEGFTSATLRRYLQHKPPQTEEVLAHGTTAPRGSRLAGTILMIAFVLAGAYYLARANFLPVTSTAPGKIQGKREYPQSQGGTQKYLEVLIREPSGNDYLVEIECDDRMWNEFQVNQEVIVHFTGGNSIDSTIERLEPKPGPVEL